MRVLAIDPSSTCTGYALLSDGPRLVEAGVIRPRAGGRVRPHITGRMGELARELSDLIRELDPDAVVIEVPTRHANHPGARGSGLTTYGMAVGAAWMAARITLWATERKDRRGRVLEHSDERTWTGSVPKSDRTALIAAQFAAYDARQDRGGDMADAIGLGLWWLGRSEKLGTREGEKVGKWEGEKTPTYNPQPTTNNGQTDQGPTTDNEPRTKRNSLPRR